MTGLTTKEGSRAMTDSVRSRFLKGLGASALGPVVTIFVQLVSVPIFLHFWGARLYGEWLILSAIPSYLALSDIGFGNVASSDMTMSVAAGRREEALETFQSTWFLVTAISVAMMVITCAGVWFVPWVSWMKLSLIGNYGAAKIMVVFSAYVLLCLQNSIMDSAFRCDGNFALGTMCLNIVRFSEAAFAVVAVACGGSPLQAAIATLCAGIAGYTTLMLVLRMKSPWIIYGTKHANLGCIRRLAAPAFAFMAFPIGNAISLQGFTVVIGIVLGPVAVVGFSTMRTLSRVGYQGLTVIGRAIWPELSAAFGAGNISLARSLHRRACQMGLVVSLTSTIAVGVIGPHAYSIWTRHAVRFEPITFWILLIVIVVNSIWFTSSIVPMASNQHERIAVAYMVGTLLSLGIALGLLKPFGLAGAAVALLCIDVSMLLLVLHVALRLLSDTPGAFARSMLSVPSFGPLFQGRRRRIV